MNNKDKNKLPMDLVDLVKKMIVSMVNKNFSDAVKIIENYPLLPNYLFFKDLHYNKNKFKLHLEIFMELIKQYPLLLNIISQQVLHLIIKHADKDMLSLIISNRPLNNIIIDSIHCNRFGQDILLANLKEALEQKNFSLALKIIKYNRTILEDFFLNYILDSHTNYYVNCLADIINDTPDLLFSIGRVAICNLANYGNKQMITNILAGIQDGIFTNGLLEKIADNGNADEEILLKLFELPYQLNINIVKMIAANQNVSKKVIKKILFLNYIDIDILTILASSRYSDLNILKFILKKIKTVLPGDNYETIDVLVEIAKNINASDDLFMQILSDNYDANMDTKLLFAIAKHYHTSLKVLKQILHQKYLKFVGWDVLSVIAGNINADAEILLQILNLMLNKRYEESQQLPLGNMWKYTPSYLLCLLASHKNTNKLMINKMLSAEYAKYINACVLAAIANNNNTDEEMLQQILSDQDSKHIDAYVLVAISGNKQVTDRILNKILTQENLLKFFTNISIAEKIFMLAEYKAPTKCIMKVLGGYFIQHLSFPHQLPEGIRLFMPNRANTVQFESLIATKLISCAENSLFEPIQYFPRKLLLANIVQLIMSFLKSYDQYVLIRNSNQENILFRDYYRLTPLSEVINNLIEKIINHRKQSLLFSKAKTTISLQAEIALSPNKIVDRAKSFMDNNFVKNRINS